MKVGSFYTNSSFIDFLIAFCTTKSFFVSNIYFLKNLLCTKSTNLLGGFCPVNAPDATFLTGGVTCLGPPTTGGINAAAFFAAAETGAPGAVPL